MADGPVKIVLLGAGQFSKIYLDVMYDVYGLHPFSIFVPEEYAGKGATHKVTTPITHTLEGLEGMPFIPATSDPEINGKNVNLAYKHGLVPCDPIVHPTAKISNSSAIGKGTIIMRNTVICHETDVQDFCMIGDNNVISHDVRIEEFSTIHAGVFIGGRTVVGSYAQIFANATIAKDLKIGMFARVALGAGVFKDVPTGRLAIGNPAKLMYTLEREEDA